MLKYKVLRRVALVLRDLEIFMLRANANPSYICVVSNIAWRFGEAAKRAAENVMMAREEAAWARYEKLADAADEAEFDYEELCDHDEAHLRIISVEVI